jgi:hypothetical protein
MADQTRVRIEAAIASGDTAYSAGVIQGAWLRGEVVTIEAREKLIEALLPVIASLPAVAGVLRHHAFDETAARLDLMRDECEAVVASVRKELPP